MTMTDIDVLRARQMAFMVEHANDAFYIINAARDILYANQAASDQTGYSVDELMGMNIGDLDPEYPQTTPERFHHNARNHINPVFETEHVRKDGSRYPVEISLVFEYMDGELLVCAYVRDITERTREANINAALQFALEHAMDAIYLYDRTGNIYFANQSACRDLGYTLDELRVMNVRDLELNFSEVANSLVWEQRDPARSIPNVGHHRRKDGTTFPVEVLVSAADIGEREFAVAFVRDISERVAAQRALEEQEERFRVITDTSPVAMLTTYVDEGRIQYANRQVARLFGRHRDELLQEEVSTLFLQRGIGQDVIREVVSGREIQNREVELFGGGREPVWVSLSTRVVELQGRRLCCCVMMDVTEARELSNQLSYHATYDDLTGLVNRREFEDRLQEVIDLSTHLQNDNVLCYLDLDQFKIINDTCGHMAGDEMLRQLARVLHESVRQDDTLARLGGDEFAILLENCSMENAEHVANKVRANIQDYRFTWEEKTFAISASMGLVPIATEAETITDVLRRADTACYAAKDAGRNRIHISRFDDEELEYRHGEMQWISRINDALDQNALELWHQQIRPASSPRRTDEHDHFELLVRMRSREGDIIMPGVFLPAAERYDLAPRIDRWVIREAFQWFARHPEEASKLSCCAINLSGQTLGESEFLNELVGLLANAAISPHQLCFEITETAAISNLSSATQFMHTLRELGCSFSLDDFGSGLSSFAYLKNLPVDYVKIDGFFVKDVITDRVDLAMVKAINDMAHALGKLTVAEFVEDKAILDCLVELGVDFVQGYGIAVPGPLESRPE